MAFETAVVIVDSGIDPNFGFLRPIGDGVGIRVSASTAELDTQWQDEIGHGSVVASTIRQGAPEAVLHPVRIFRTRLIAPVTAFAEAITWAASHEMQLLNLSIGVTKLQWRDTFERALRVATRAGVVVVSPVELGGAPCLPGCLPGAVGVRHDPSLAPGAFAVRDGVVAALGGVGPLPPRARSTMPDDAALAVATTTGTLARWLADVGPRNAAECERYLSESPQGSSA